MLLFLSFSFWVAWLACSLSQLSRPPQETWYQTMPLIVFDKWPHRKGCFHWVNFWGEMKIILRVEFPREVPDRSDNDNSQKKKLWNSFDLILTLLEVAILLVYTVIVGCGFSRLPQKQGVEEGNNTRMTQSSLILLRFSSVPQIVARLWLISRVQRSWSWHFFFFFLLMV